GGQRNWGKNRQYEGRYKDGHRTLGDNRPLRGWKGELYEGGVRVPALANWPGRLKPGKLDAVVSALDWYPTFAHLAGYELPSDLPLEGQNIWPLLVDPSKAAANSKPRTLYWNTGSRSAVRDGPWKLIASGGKKKTYQLFNLDDDPHEKTDLSGRLEPQALRLRGLLEREASKDFRLRIKNNGTGR
ncbi:MAG: sulfatase-like hydrolase/transferase, partial [Planctomycetes bacterium]|nr:sulfatase-like hydrolase/transferase [Planctomycetota bacterium]